MGKQVAVGIIGLGTVGGGTLKVLARNRELIASRSTDIRIAKVCDLDHQHAKTLVEAEGLTEDIITSDYKDLTLSDDIDIVVELIGGIHPAKEIILEALNNGKSVVTANKDLVAAHGKELFDAADANGVDMMFEPAVAGAIPIIKALKDSMKANNIKQVMGIVNGTTNYILSEMTETGADFAPCLKQAQDLGYAESDPTNDVEGYDAARKMAILASIAFNSNTTFDDVYVEGITHITKHDISYAGQLGYIIKLLGIAKADEKDDNQIEVRVHPVLIKRNHPLAAVNEAYNAVFVEGDAIGTSMLYGKGAGELPTASAVVGDVIAAAENVVNNTKGVSGLRFFNHKVVKPISEVQGSYFIRMMVKDEPMVLAQIAEAFGKNDVSLDSVIQKQIENSG
ncbi:MAG: homoserine dehydrogenase, partial [Bacillota bacterium]